jgi:hypothetical protein
MPIGYTTYYGGTFEDLRVQQAQVAAQEESTPEGTLVLLELTLPEPATPETLVELNSRLLAAGVPLWAGYSSIVFTDASNPQEVYIAWTKGFAWTPIILGIVFLVLPLILGAVLWFLIPQPVKDAMMLVGVMMIMIPIMGMVTKEK